MKCNRKLLFDHNLKTGVRRTQQQFGYASFTGIVAKRCRRVALKGPGVVSERDKPAGFARSNPFAMVSTRAVLGRTQMSSFIAKNWARQRC